MQKAIYRALLLTLVSPIWGLILSGDSVLAHSYVEPRVTRVNAGPPEASIRTIFFQPGGRLGVVGGTNGLLAYTHDGGERWYDSVIVWEEPKEVRQRIEVLRITPVRGMGPESFNGISFSLVAIGGPYVLLSVDGGARWYPLTKIRLGASEPRSVRLDPYLVGVDISFENKGQFLLSEVATVKNGYEFKRSTLFSYALNKTELTKKSSDVVRLPREFEGVEFTDLFANKGSLILVGQNGQILVNKGKLWSYVRTPGKDTLLDVVFTTSSKGWAVGKNGTILSTYDGGSTWTSVEVSNQSSIEDYRAIQFVDPCRGWIVGKRGLLLYSQEKGSKLKWTETHSGTPFDLYAVTISEDARNNHGRSNRFSYDVWAAGDNKTLVKLFVTEEERCNLR